MCKRLGPVPVTPATRTTWLTTIPMISGSIAFRSAPRLLPDHGHRAGKFFCLQAEDERSGCGSGYLYSNLLPGHARQDPGGSDRPSSRRRNPVSFTLVSSPTFVARGTITRPPGAGFTQVMLRSSENPEMRPAGQDRLREDGAFEFRGLLPGRYNALLMVVDLAAMQKGQAGNTPQMQVVL